MDGLAPIRSSESIRLLVAANEAARHVSVVGRQSIDRNEKERARERERTTTIDNEEMMSRRANRLS